MILISHKLTSIKDTTLRYGFDATLTSIINHLEPLRTLCLQHEENQSWFRLILWEGSLHIHNLRQSHLRVFGRTRRQDANKKSHEGEILCIHILPEFASKDRLQTYPLSLLQYGVALYTAYKD